MRWFWWSFAFAVVVICDTRKHRRYNEVGIVNEAEANIRIRCQSLRSDQNDVFLGIGNQFRFRFHDIDLGNRHFWCDVYGLFGLDETFDVFGRAAPSRSNVTWLIKSDGLYMDFVNHRIREWIWNYPPFDTYSEL